jgi:hypothetical protein
VRTKRLFLLLPKKHLHRKTAFAPFPKIVKLKPYATKVGWFFYNLNADPATISQWALHRVAAFRQAAASALFVPAVPDAIQVPPQKYPAEYRAHLRPLERRHPLLVRE